MAQMQEQQQATLPFQAIIVLCLVGAGVAVLCGYAVSRHYFGDNNDDREQNLQSEVHDGMTQTQYMRMVRLRAQDDLQRTYHPTRHNNDYHSSKHPLSSVNSV